MIRKRDMPINSEHDRGYGDGLSESPRRPGDKEQAEYLLGYELGRLDRPKVIEAVVALRNAGLKDEARNLEEYLDT